MHELPPPPATFYLGLLAGGSLASLLTWLMLRNARTSAYEHGIEHGRLECEGELMELRARLVERERELSAARAELRQR